MHSKTCIIIVGPTAVGKTAVAIRIAQHFQTEIISCDSRQCFRELNIGVARPSTKELAAVRHHFIASHGIQELVTAATFEQFALQKAHELFLDHNVVVLTGGTGLYVKAFCEGLDQIPAVPMAVREAIQLEYAEQGISWLQESIKNLDPQYVEQGEMQNPQRLMRALEVVQTTGRSILSFQKQSKRTLPFNIIKIGLNHPRELMYDRINRRVEGMMEAGLVEEVRELYPNRHLNALQTVGYTELFDYFEGKCSLAAAMESIQQHTRHYAKRQLTWFRKDTSIAWMEPDANQVLNHIQTKMNINT